MKAYAYTSAESAPILIEQSLPEPTGRDLLIAIEAIAVNPVDTKVKAAIQGSLDRPKIIGWDAAGTVVATGQDCELFKVGDKVFYAGNVQRDGCYASHQLVDERIVGFAPRKLSAAEAAAMPLTSITAWEALFSRMKIYPNIDKGKTLLIIGGAGGVGSVAIQLAKQVAEMTVVATASRETSADWCRELGADHVINHHHLEEQYRQLGIHDPDYILCLGDTDDYYDTVTDLIAPQGLICFVVSSQQDHNIEKLKTKSAGIVWEFMFTRPVYQTSDLTAQHQLLNRIANMLDEGRLSSTLKETLGPINADTLTLAHQKLQEGHTLGKMVLTAPVE